MNEFNILVVDDAFFMRMLLKKTLTNKPKGKYKFNIVSEAQDGKEGLELYKILKADIVTLDINMPKVNGLEFLKKVRKINPKVHCIIISTTKNEEVRVEAKKDNVYYLPKSFQPEYFYGLLDEIATNIIKEKQNYIHKNEKAEEKISIKPKEVKIDNKIDENVKKESNNNIVKPKEDIKKETVKEKIDFESSKLPTISKEDTFNVEDEELEIPFLYDYDKEMENLENEMTLKNNVEEIQVIKPLMKDNEDEEQIFNIDEEVTEEPEISELDDLDLDLLKLKQNFDLDISSDNTEKNKDSSLKMELKEPIDTYNIKNKQQGVIIPPPKKFIKEPEKKFEKKEELVKEDIPKKKKKKSWSLFDFIFRRNKNKK